MSRITTALQALFDRHRIVVWHDDEGELAGELDGLSIGDVEVLRADNNEFGLKHRMLREAVTSKFLVYHAGSRPDDLGNWLLDVELAHGVFHADQVALWLSELGLGLEFADIVQPHQEFFRSQQRTDALVEALDSGDTPTVIRLKMLGICADAPANLDSILERLLADLNRGLDARWALVERSGLEDFLWDQLERRFGYASDQPGMQDFAVSVFKAAFAIETGGEADLTSDSVLLLGRWKDSARFGEDFDAFSQKYAALLNVAAALAKRPLAEILSADTFELVDRRILSDLASSIATRTMASKEVERIVRRRRETHWFRRYEDAYAAMQAAAQFFAELSSIIPTVNSISHGIEQYRRTWFRVDQLYRRFHFHVRKSGRASLFSALRREVDDRYTNDFLLPLNEAWQAHVDAEPTWVGATSIGLAAAVRGKSSAFLAKGNKLVLVISDALRYEAGEELMRRVVSEDRYDGDIDFAVAPLPSYTQLGMASLLPHDALAIGGDGSVMLDGVSTTGLAARRRILEQSVSGQATALLAKDFLDMDGAACRELTKQHDVIYLYHNRIDATGDKRDSEDQVFEATEVALDELVRVLKKLFSANASNVLVTADHGYLYQDQDLEDADFLSDVPAGEVTFTNRRFVLGTGLVASSGFRHYSAEQLGLSGDVEVLVPRSIHRLRVKGAGSRYVHGGASLQEVVVPVLHVTKKRTSDVSKVEVDIFQGSTSVITTGQVVVTLYQTAPVTEKRKARTLRAGLYTKGGELLSEEKTLVFDLASGHERDRESKHTFILTSRADALNREEVEFRLEEQFEDTTHWQLYTSRRYTLQRSFTSDFDFD